MKDEEEVLEDKERNVLDDSSRFTDCLLLHFFMDANMAFIVCRTNLGCL